MNRNKTIGKRSAVSKINLFLQVTGRRADGYHEIKTLFLPLSTPSDIITVYRRDSSGIEITTDSTQVPVDESNICFKAAMKFAEFADISPAWRIHIEKHIPVAAGLGGGSSDAAALLQILNDHIKKIDQSSLRKLALSLGADVPFFLNPVPSIATGIGEELTPVELKRKLHILLVYPQFPISAKWAYQHLAVVPEGKSEEQPGVGNYLDVEDISGDIVNDLAPAVYEKFPVMKLLTEQMVRAGAVSAGMSGSGSTIFAICENHNSLLKIAENIDKEWGSAVKIIH
jgi:4-diphosphocytidyl-2-C-methyl-D-erythritol kinase